MMKIPTTSYGPVTLLSPDGPLMGGELTEALHDKVQDLLSGNNSLVVIDLSQVRWINSSGIGTLMGCRSECMAQDGQLVLACVNSKIMDLLNSLQLDTVLVCRSSLEEAVVMLGGKME
jgi:anti-sigma B factor antagonist